MTLHQVIADSQTCLASTNDHRSELLITHSSNPPTPLKEVARDLQHRVTSALNPINFAATVLDKIVIISHRFSKGLVGHQLFFHGEEIIDGRYSCFGDDGPVRLA